jgi:hypothetical protein
MDWTQLTIDAAELDCDSLLEDWRWLVPTTLQPFCLSIFGDWFFEDSAGGVIFLATVSAQLSEIAPSRAVFLTEREKPENLEEWFMADLARLCRERGLIPGAGQCLSFKIPPVLSGPLKVKNIEVSDLMLHQSILAQIHKGVKDIPEGTRIDAFTFNDEIPRSKKKR